MIRPVKLHEVNRYVKRYVYIAVRFLYKSLGGYNRYRTLALSSGLGTWGIEHTDKYKRHLTNRYGYRENGLTCNKISMIHWKDDKEFKKPVMKLSLGIGCLSTFKIFIGIDKEYSSHFHNIGKRRLVVSLL